MTINRMWMRYFGRGIVETEEDFGTQGSPPTHPELLDWLAGEFMRRGWSQKAMHRLIVTSATYRQTSDARKDLHETDPRNLLLARQERLRVGAEIVRDAALSASGLLNARIGGPGVRPPQPDGVYSFTQVKKNWTVAQGGDRFRRAIYTVFYRSASYPLLTTFDAPDFQTVCTRRPRSNTPLQSLTLANDPALLEIPQGLARRLARDVPGEFAARLDARLRHAFVLCYSRRPAAEVNLALNLGGGFGVVVATTLLARRAQFHQSRLVENLTPYDAAYQAAPQNLARIFGAQGGGDAAATQQAQGVIYGSVLRQANALAY